MHVDKVGRRDEFVIPDFLEQHGTRQQLIATLHHIFQQTELTRQQIDHAIAPFDGAPDQIEFERPCPQRRLARLRRTAQQRFYSRDEFDEREWFGEIVVATHPQSTDAVVDRAIGIVAKKYDRGGPFDAGVRGVRASLVHADRAERVILRPQPHLLAVVPPSFAERNARALAGARLAEPAAGDAVYLRLVDPHHPMPEIPESITEMRMRVVPRVDAGADVFVECDTSDADAASQAAEGIRRMVRRHNDAITSLLTHGLFDHVGVTSDASTVKVHLTATRDQIETVVALVGDLLGVEPGEPPAPAATSSSAPALPSKPPRPR